ncbi:MAG: YHYH protein [Phycisphaerales bacterium]|nr:YHYH protein [Phycisphaerales bacterium]
MNSGRLMSLTVMLTILAAGAALADSTTRLGCDSDLDGDAQVTVNDVLEIVAAWGTPDHDTDGDGVCGVGEILQVLAEFGSTCHPFTNGVIVTMDYDAGVAIVQGTGLADHPMGPFDGSEGCFNPNTPTDQDFTWRIPLNPVYTNNPPVNLLNTFGAVGVCTNGVSWYNPYDGGGVDAPSTICMDEFNAHPSPDGSYHYHQASDWAYPTDASGHSILMGYAFDGYPVYGPYETEGVFAKDLTGDMALDECNTHSDPVRGIHYHAISFELDQSGFPWIAGCYRGVPDESNFMGGGGGPPPGGCNSGCGAAMAPPPVCMCLQNNPEYAYCCTDWDIYCCIQAQQYCGYNPPGGGCN